jgi:hypothetical protein
MKKIILLIFCIVPFAVIAQELTRQLKDIVVSGSRPVIERKIDRVIFNVENSVIASGGNVWDALSKAPGVQAQPDHAVTANRKAVVIYMDNKPLRISGEDLASYLRGLPADQVSKIEVFSNPPAQFDAQGAAVIHIISKKAKQQGLNIALNGNVTQATYVGYTAGSTLNYRKNKLNLYGSYNYSDRKNTMDHNVFIDYGSSYWESPNHNIYTSNSHNYRFGADYQLSPLQILGVLMTGNKRMGKTEGRTPARVTSNNRSVLDSTLQTDTRASTAGSRYTFNINYNLKLDTVNHSLNIDLDYSPFQSKSDAYIDNLSFLPDGSPGANPFHIYTPATQQIAIYSGKADYTKNIRKIGALVTGMKYSSIISKNIFDFYNNRGGGAEPVPANSNHFDYRENIAAAYASISGVIGQLNWQGGLRAEYTRTKGYAVILDSLTTRNYFKLFPTLFLQYKWNDHNELLLNYAYRINRPEYARLNPAKHYSTPYNFIVGNPALQPAYVHNIELGYTFRRQYNLTAFYTATHDMFTNVSQQDNVTRQYYDTQQNLGLSLHTGLRFSAPLQLASWWNLSLLASGGYQQERSAYLQGSYNYHNFVYDATLSQAFTLSKKAGIKAEIISAYHSPGIQGIFNIGNYYSVDAGLKAAILNGQGTLRLAANDIFFTNTYQIRVNYLNQNNGFFHRNDSRNVTLSFSYSLGKNIAVARTRNTSSEDEKRRAQ